MICQDKLKILQAFRAMKLPPHEREAHDNVEMRDSLILQIMHFPVFALPDPDNPVFIGGFFHALGVATAWMVTGEGFEKQARVVLPMQRQICRTMYAALGVHRMQLEVDSSRPQDRRWAEKLGFEYETVLRRAGPRAEDFAIYVWPDERGL